MMLLGRTETKLWTLKHGSKSIQTSLILRQRPPKPYDNLVFIFSERGTKKVSMTEAGRGGNTQVAVFERMIMAKRSTILEKKVSLAKLYIQKS